VPWRVRIVAISAMKLAPIIAILKLKLVHIIAILSKEVVLTFAKEVV
jgi:hypothetical protein